MVGKAGQLSRRRPWPYDLYIEDVPVMLKPDTDGNMVSQKTRTLDQSAPTTFEYGSANPYKERTFLWTKLYQGFGESVAPATRPRKYFWAEKMDLSINGQGMKGPNFENHVETIHASAGEVRQFIQALHGGVLTTFALCANGVWRRVSDGTWTASLTIGLGGTALPAGQFPQQAVRFKGRYTSAVDGLYVGTATGNIWQYNGAAWTQPGPTEGPGDGSVQGECRFIERIGDELWVGGDYWVVKCEANPLLRASYSAVIWIGDQSSKITWLKQIENQLIIFKEDDIYTISTDGVDQELFPYLRQRKAAGNGKNASVWLNEMWVPFGGQTFRLTAQGALIPDGPEQLIENTSEIQGSFVAGAGHNVWFFYELYYNNAGHSYLIKHGTWADEGTDSANVQFINSAHHGALYDWAKQGTCLEILSGIHSSGNERLYVGFSDGTLAWAVLPRNSMSPAEDPNCEFTYLDSYLYLPSHHSNFQADNKLFRGISVPALRLTNTEYAEVEYREDTVNDAAEWTTLAPDNPRFTVPGQRIQFDTTTPVFAKLMQFRIKLIKDPTPGASPIQLSPVIEGLVIHEQIRPSISLEYNFVVLASSFLAKHNGIIDRRQGVQIRDALLNLTAGASTVSVTLPDADVQELTIIDYREVISPRSKRRGLQYEIAIGAIQLATLSQGVLSTGLTYRTLEQYTWAQLEALL